MTTDDNSEFDSKKTVSIEDVTSQVQLSIDLHENPSMRIGDRVILIPQVEQLPVFHGKGKKRVIGEKKTDPPTFQND